MLDPIQWILAIVDQIILVALEAGREVRDHVKTAPIKEAKPCRPTVWRSVPRPDV